MLGSYKCACDLFSHRCLLCFYLNIPPCCQLHVRVLLYFIYNPQRKRRLRSPITKGEILLYRTILHSLSPHFVVLCLHIWVLTAIIVLRARVCGKKTQGRDPFYLDTKTPNLGSHGSKKKLAQGILAELCSQVVHACPKQAPKRN